MTKAQGLETKRLFTLSGAVKAREELKAQGKTYVFTNGCFDLLHPGHVSCLEEARALGDVLWIALNSEKSVGSLKGAGRPILGDEARASVLGALRCVDGIIIFDTPRLDKEILALKPDIYVKAGDYTVETLDSGERHALESVGAQIKILPFVNGYSTSGIIEKIINAEKLKA